MRTSMLTSGYTAYATPSDIVLADDAELGNVGTSLSLSLSVTLSVSWTWSFTWT